MQPEHLDKARHVLTDMRRHVVQTVRAEILESAEDTSDGVTDVYDAAADDRERELRLLLTHRDSNKLAAIDDALARIRAGTYGVCDACEEDIGDGRLALLPFTRLCVTCQAASEREQAQHRKNEPARAGFGIALGDSDDE
jgi:DnaK suppressor protein